MTNFTRSLRFAVALLLCALCAGSASAQMRASRAGRMGAFGPVGIPASGGGLSRGVETLPAMDYAIHSAFPLQGGPRVSAPAQAAARPALPRDPQTGLYGVTPAQVEGIVALLREHYGDDLIDLAALGSRVRGTASAVKNFRPVREESDLDLAPLLRPSDAALRVDQGKLGEKLKALLGFGVDLHTNFAFDGRRYSGSVPLDVGEEEPVRIPLRPGEAVRLAH